MTNPTENADYGRIVAVLRAYGMHDPECAVYKRDKAQAMTSVFLYPAECDCWLGTHNER